MANGGRPTMNKRRKEQERRQWQEKKAARRVLRAEESKNRPESEGDEDPDIAGIVPGPQPRPEGLEDLDDLEEEAE